MSLKLHFRKVKLFMIPVDDDISTRATTGCARTRSRCRPCQHELGPDPGQDLQAQLGPDPGQDLQAQLRPDPGQDLQAVSTEHLSSTRIVFSVVNNYIWSTLTR